MSRHVWIIIGFAASFAVVVAGLAVTMGPTAVEVGRELHGHRGIVRRMLPREDPDVPLLVWLGDSTMMAHQRIRAYPNQVLQRLRGPVETRNMYIPALDPYHHYFLLGPILEQEPDVLVIALHFRLLRPETAFARNDFSSHLPASELGRAAALPLHEREITLPALLLYRLLRFEPFEEAYYFAQGVRQSFYDSTRGELSGERQPRSGKLRKGLRAQAEMIARYDVDLHAGHPLVKMVAATVELAAREGTRVLAVVSPIPVDALAHMGLYDAGRFEARIRVLADAVESNGGELLDLHDLLPRDGFSDAAGHMGREGTTAMVEALLPHVQRLVDQARAAE